MTMNPIIAAAMAKKAKGAATAPIANRTMKAPQVPLPAKSIADRVQSPVNPAQAAARNNVLLAIRNAMQNQGLINR